MSGAPRPLPRGFYRRPTLEVARDLIGKVLVHDDRVRAARPAGGGCAGLIVEVEAYAGEDDPACHAAPGLTARNRPLYGPPGHAYVYLNYGLHFLLNAVTEPIGSPGAVLIRAVLPLDGLEAMRRRRMPRPGAGEGGPDVVLGRGPGNVTRAFGVTLRHNRLDLCGSRLYIEDRGVPVGAIRWSGRVGITVGTERRWRAYLDGCAAVSSAPSGSPRRSRAGRGHAR